MMIAKQVLRRALLGAVVACTMIAGAAQAVTYNVDNVNLQYGFMNVFELPSNGGGYIFGSGWGIADLNASFASGSWTFTPNTIGDPNPFWYTPSGGPGAAGNKDMDANLYAQFDGTLAGQTLTFIGNVSQYTLVAPYQRYVYIRELRAGLLVGHRDAHRDADRRQLLGHAGPHRRSRPSRAVRRRNAWAVRVGDRYRLEGQGRVRPAAGRADRRRPRGAVSSS
jgi:hypothetical protein